MPPGLWRERRERSNGFSPGLRYHRDMKRAPQHLRTYFVTTTSANRRRLFQVEPNALLFMNVLQEQRVKGHLELHAFVVMPDHVHALLTPAPDVSLEKAVQFIKGNFSHRLKSKLPVWTPSFNESQVRDRIAFDSFQHYIHENPVRAYLVSTAEMFPFSSASRQKLIDPPPMHLRNTGAEAPLTSPPVSGA